MHKEKSLIPLSLEAENKAMAAAGTGAKENNAADDSAEVIAAESAEWAKLIRSLHGYFTHAELALWGCSVLLIVASFALFDRENLLTLAASLVGVSSLIFCAKGNPLGQFLMVIFSLLYGLISLSYSYYGEMLTYLGMTMPMAVLALISWLKNPYRGKRSQVQVNRLGRREWPFVALMTALVTVVFYFILAAWNTVNLVPSTISVSTSFVAVYLTFRRSPFYAVGYAANDVVLIVLWSMAALDDSSYVSVVVCFAAFLVNDLYGFVNWRKMAREQRLR